MPSPANLALTIFFLACTCAITAPGLRWIGDGLWLGVPRALWWNVLWVLLSFLALLAHWLLAGRKVDDDG